MNLKTDQIVFKTVGRELYLSADSRKCQAIVLGRETLLTRTGTTKSAIVIKRRHKRTDLYI